MALVSAAGPGQSGPFRRNGRKQPLVIQGPAGTRTGPFTDADQLPYFRASGVKDLVEDKGGVANWAQRGLMWATGHDEGLRLSVAAVDDWESDEGKARFRDLIGQAEQVSGMTAKREGGTALHGLFARLDRGQPLPPTIAPEHRCAVEAYDEIRRLFVVHEIELTVVCDALGVGGNLDKVLSPRGVMVPRDRKGNQIAPEVTPDQRIVGDVKAAQNADYFGAFALQLAPYAHGIAYREEEDPVTFARQQDDGIDLWSQAARLARIKAVHRTPINVRTDVALLIHVPFKGASADLYWFDLARGHAAAKLAMQVRELRGQFRSMFALADRPQPIPMPTPVSTIPRPAFAGQIFSTIKSEHDHARLLEWLHRVPSEAEAMELWRTNHRIWTDEHTQAVAARLAELAASRVAS